MSAIFQCHYIKSCIYYISGNFHAYETDLKYNHFSNQFAHIKVEKKWFIKQFKRYMDHYRKKKVALDRERKKVVNEYSGDSWNMLTDDMKLGHTLNMCHSCSLLPSLFPPPTPSVFLNLAKPDTSLTPEHHLQMSPITPANSIVYGNAKTQTTPFGSLKINIDIPLPEKMFSGFEKAAASTIVNGVNREWEKVEKFKRPFTEVLCKVRGTNLKKRESDSERVKRLRKNQKT